MVVEKPNTLNYGSVDDLKCALGDWVHAIGSEYVLSSDCVLHEYSLCTLPTSTPPVAVLKPKSVADVQTIVNIAQSRKIPLYPVSCGRNWGYGSANPVCKNCVVVDLSRMDQIIKFDSELGLVTVEPGVTQQALNEFLRRENLKYMTPVNGAGPLASIVGNALERGHGITPFADHFAAVTSIEAVLPNGDIYRSAHAEMGGIEADRAFKWGIGPYLDGLFSQGNLGIVTSMTVALSPRPQHVEAFVFFIKHEEQLEAAVDVVRGLIRDVGANLGSINLMNDRRILSMRMPYPFDLVAKNGILDKQSVRRFSMQFGAAPWVGFGALYCERSLRKVTRNLIRKRLSRFSKKIIFFSRASVRRRKKIFKRMPFSKKNNTLKQLDHLEAAINHVMGITNDVALPLAYWKKKDGSQEAKLLDPARDRCGLIWYSPIVIFKSKVVREYADMVTEICQRYGIEPLITLTTLQSPNSCLMSTVPLLFDRSDSSSSEAAMKCYEELLLLGAEKGFVPYRVNVQVMNRITNDSHAHWRLARKIKEAIDPHDILSPGRYASTQREL